MRLAGVFAIIVLSAAVSERAWSQAADQSCLTAAKSAVEAARKPITPEVPTAPVAMGSLKGKSVWFISPTQAAPYALGVSQGLQVAAAAAGLEAHVFDGKGQPTLFNEGVAQAVAAKAAAIVTYAIDPSLLAQSLPQANAANIPLLISMTSLPAPQGVYASINPDAEALGRLQADAALVQTQCKLNGGVVYASNFIIQKKMKEGTYAEVKKLCPGCTLTEMNVQLPTVSTQLAPQTTATMARLPELNAFIAAWDGAAVFQVAAIEQAQRSDVKVIGANGNSANLDFMRQGRVQTYDAAYPPAQYLGWQLFDQAARAIAKQDPPQITVQVQMLDKDNIGPAGSADNVVFPGLVGYEAAFKKVWGLN